MRVITWKVLKEFGETYPDAMPHLKGWRSVVQKSQWKSPAELKEQFGNASFVGGYRVVFNIAGNKYRLVVDVRYDMQMIFVRGIMTHAEYDEVDVRKL